MGFPSDVLTKGLRPLAVLALMLLGGCATSSPRVRWRDGEGSAGGFPSTGQSRQEALAPFLECDSPACFIERQRGVDDMHQFVRELDDWSAVRLGALGPLREGASELNRKRAAFLVTATAQYGTARAEIFALCLVHTAFDDDVKEVLGLLARDKRLWETLGPMRAVREALGRRGLDFTDTEDRPERLGDVARGVASAASEALSSSELIRGARYLTYSTRRGHLPPPYQEALDAVERAELEQALSPGNVTLGALDALTFGVPLGFYNLVAGTCHGVYSLSEGHYEQAARELSASAVLVALYAGGKGVRLVAETHGRRLGPLRVPELGVPGLTQVAERLWQRLGGEGLRELPRYLQARREAALWVYEGGEPAALALHAARGDVARAQAWLAEAKTQRAGPTTVKAEVGKGPGGVVSLVDETMGLSREVVEARLAHAELDAVGPRLSADVTVLGRQRPAVEAPPLGAQGHPLWSEYVAYWDKRVEELRQGQGRKPPLSWEGYGPKRGLFARGLDFERHMVALLREDAALPRARRRFLQDFERPRIETNVGVSKPGHPDVRFADVLVIEESPSPGQPPRVESFSFKSRDLSRMNEQALVAQTRTDASEALRYYGETLWVRRPSLKHLGAEVSVQRVRLIYEGGKLKPTDPRAVASAKKQALSMKQEVEILFQ